MSFTLGLYQCHAGISGYQQCWDQDSQMDTRLLIHVVITSQLGICKTFYTLTAWDHLDSHSSSAMLCTSGGNQLMSIQDFQMYFFFQEALSLKTVEMVLGIAKRSPAACLKASLKPQNVKNPNSSKSYIWRRRWLTLLLWDWCNWFVSASTAAFCGRVCICSTESFWGGSLEHLSGLSRTEQKRLSLTKGFQLLGFVTQFHFSYCARKEELWWKMIQIYDLCQITCPGD